MIIFHSSVATIPTHTHTHTSIRIDYYKHGKVIQPKQERNKRVAQRAQLRSDIIL